MIELALTLALAAAAAPPAPAPPAPDVTPVEGPVALDGPDQVRALCEALTPPERAPTADRDPVAQGRAAADRTLRRAAALRRRYRVTIPGERLRFAPYDPAEGELALSQRSALTGAGGALRLWSTSSDGLPVAVDAAGAGRIAEVASRRELALELTFVLPDDDEDAVACTHPNGSSRYGLGVEPFSWQYVQSGQVLARGGAGAERPLVTAAQGALPRVEIAAPVGADGEALQRALQGRAPDLERCYRSALQRDPALDGMLVADLDLAGAGAPRSVRMGLDSVQDEGLSSCVRNVVAATRFPGAGGGRAQVPIEFSLQAPTASR